eukprot:5462628-Prymnesium_polylepis.1
MPSLGLTPPMDWRSWNAYHGDVTQAKMQATMDVLAAERNGTSLRALGYTIAGLDDAWQACGTGVKGTFYDQLGNPLVNATRFPSLQAMVAHGHAKGLHVGFYVNNCICGFGPGTFEGLGM